MILTVAEAESVLTWDFDVIEGDCHFQVLRHKRPREANMVSTTCLGDTSITKPSIRPGIDAQVVERPILCRQGDSVQVRRLVLRVVHQFCQPTQILKKFGLFGVAEFLKDFAGFCSHCIMQCWTIFYG